jgi:hypothetical protein
MAARAAIPPLTDRMEHQTGDGALTCIHHRDNFFVGIGHPRCGTGFTAHLLQAAGLRIGHELVHHDGIVSWMLPAERYRNPYRDALGPIGGFNRIFCVTRSPLEAIPSIIPENATSLSFNFRKNILRAKFGETLPAQKTDETRLLAAVMSYTLWFELCMSFLPQIIYRVDRPEDDALLSEYVGRPLLRSDEIYRNSRPKARVRDFTPAQLAALPPDWLRRFAAIAEGLGYPEDAAIIAGLGG